MAFTTAYGFVEFVEQELGWVVPSETPERRRTALIAETSKVKRRIASDPALYQWANLATTVIWLKGKRQTVSPWAVLGHVQAALKATYRPAIPRPSDSAEAIAAAVRQEQEQRVEGWQGWVRKLTRAQGAGREDVYEQWRQARDENP